MVTAARTPQPVIDVLCKAIVAATEHAKTGALLLAQGYIDVLDAAASRQKIVQEGELNAEILKEAGIEKQ